jgi:hypothetical protein
MGALIYDWDEEGDFGISSIAREYISKNPPRAKSAGGVSWSEWMEINKNRIDKTKEFVDGWLVQQKSAEK